VPKVIDHTGERYGRLLVQSCFVKDGATRCVCLCDCGNNTTVRANDVRQGDIASCGCIRNEKLILRSIKHRECNTKIHQAWQGIKKRCYNPNNQYYYMYGGVGITMSPLWKDDYIAFRDYIGHPPDDGKKYSVDRIEGDKGYEPGNVRWATDKEQARNRRIKNTNKTGITGVSLRMASDGSKRYVSQWVTQEGEVRSKSFSIKKHGEAEAFRLACEAREQAIKELNAQGAGYSENHGKEREVTIE
jgi:hypothetical protein